MKVLDNEYVAFYANSYMIVGNSWGTINGVLDSYYDS
jgi:hypothetical protein